MLSTYVVGQDGKLHADVGLSVAVHLGSIIRFLLYQPAKSGSYNIVPCVDLVRVPLHLFGLLLPLSDLLVLILVNRLLLIVQELMFPYPLSQAVFLLCSHADGGSREGSRGVEGDCSGIVGDYGDIVGGSQWICSGP